MSGRGKRELSEDDGNIQYLHCGGGYMGLGTCQNSSSCTQDLCITIFVNLYTDTCTHTEKVSK